MSEPPRLGTSRNVYTGGTSGGFGSTTTTPPFQPFPPPSGGGGGNRGRTLLFAFGITFGLAILACSGVVLFTYYQFARPNAMSEAYRENREQPGQPLPTALAGTLASSQPVDIAEHPKLQELLIAIEEGEYADGTELVNADRMYQEMRNSGLAVGLNELSKLIITSELSSSYYVPSLGKVALVDLHWLVPERELRVAVASYSDWEPHPSLHLLYLIKSKAYWQIYDHHDLMYPLSEAQQRAATTQLAYALQDKLIVLEYDLDEIYSDSEVSIEDKPRRTAQAYRRRSMLPAELQAQARWFTLDYLLEYNDSDELEKFLDQFPDDNYAGAHFARAQLAIRQDRLSEAFQHCKKLMQAVGWHPAAAVLAADSAKSTDELRLATEWLERGLDVVHGHPATIQSYFRIADKAALSRLTQRLVTLDDGDARMVEILSTYPKDEYLERMMSDGLVDQLPAAKLYCQFASTIGLNDPQAMLRSVKEILEYSDLEKIDEQLEKRSNRALSDIAWSQVLEVVDQLQGDAFESLNQLISLAKEPSTLLRQLRDQTLYDITSTDNWENRSRLVERARADETLADEASTQVAWAICQLRLGHTDVACQQLVQIIRQHRQELLTQNEVPDFMYSLFEAASESAAKAGRWQELVEAIDEPETAYLVLSSYLAERMDSEGLQSELDAWYEQQSAPRFWLDYYRAKQAYATGNWELADELIRAAIDGADADPRTENYSFSHAVYNFAPYSEDSSDWIDDRVDWAARSGHLVELVERLVQSDKLPDYVWSIEWKLTDSNDVDLLKEICVALSKVDVDTLLDNEVERLALVLEGRAFALDRDYDMAMSRYQRLIDMESRVINELVQFTLLDSDSPFPELLSKLGETDSDARIQSQILAAIGGQDSELLADAIAETKSQPYGLARWGTGLGMLSLKGAGLWPQMNEVVPAKLNYISDAYEANGMLLLAEKASERLDLIASGFAEKFGSPLESVQQLDRLPGAVGAWTAKTEEGSLLVVAYDEPLSLDLYNEPMERLQEWSQGIVCISMMQSEYGPSPAPQMRQLALASSRSLEASGYFDFTGGTWFTGEGWTEQLAFAIDTGINRNAPTEHYFISPSYARRFNTSVDSLFIGRGLIVEELQIERHLPAEGQSTDDVELFRLLDESLLVPAVSVGDIVEN